MPSVAVRFTIEAAFLALVALGAVLAELEPIVIVALIAGACVLVALVERAYAREAARVRDDSAAAEEAPSEAAPKHVEVVDAEPAPEAEAEPEPAREPELAVSGRSARAILASGPPPAPDAPRRKPAPEPGPELRRASDPEPEPDSSGRPREWNVWELQRLVREQAGDDRQEEWTAMVVSLRDFARADGTLPHEFDELVRDSFGALLAADGVRTEAVAP